MREIIFRGRRVDNDEWAYGYLVEATNVITGKKATLYDSIADAEKQTGINRAYIYRLCHGKGKQCFGYTWFVTRPPQSYVFVEEI